MNTKEEVLKNCKVEGVVVKLPNIQLERNVYQEVAKSLELIGGKWKGGKVFGFVFKEDPTELLEQIANGEKRNLKKEFQFFATPDAVAADLIEMAFIDAPLVGKVLEPSAGQGAIINAIHKLEFKELNVRYCETMEINRSILSKIPYTECVGDDFLLLNAPEEYAIIIANPPFAKNQDIDHIYKMYEVCRKGGRIVSVSSTHWQESGNKKETEFRNWLEKIGAVIHKIDKGAFRESGTTISALIVVINK